MNRDKTKTMTNIAENINIKIKSDILEEVKE